MPVKKLKGKLGSFGQNSAAPLAPSSAPLVVSTAEVVRPQRHDPLAPFRLPTPPPGWTWGPLSETGILPTQPTPHYLTNQHIVLTGPETELTYRWGGNKYKTIPIYEVKLKKQSACCGIGAATYMNFPEPQLVEKDKIALLIEAIEIENAKSLRNISMLTLSKYYATSEPLIEVLEERGWKVAIPDFENQVWHDGHPKNKVSMWYKDMTELAKAWKKRDHDGRSNA